MRNKEDFNRILQGVRSCKENTVNYYKEMMSVLKELCNIKSDLFEKEKIILKEKLTKKKQYLESPLEFLENRNIQLAFCGANSTGKTTTLLEFLNIPPILPTGAGTISSRNVKFEYCAAGEARVELYEDIFSYKKQKANLSLKPEESTSLAEFANIINEMDDCVYEESVTKCREILYPYLLRGNRSESDLIRWSKYFVVIYWPSEVLQLGIDVFDTPGYIYCDESVFTQNISDLMKAVRPTLIFCYDNQTFGGDSMITFRAVKQEFQKDGIFFSPFFLFTKADFRSTLFNSRYKFDNELPTKDIQSILNLQRDLLFSQLKTAFDFGKVENSLASNFTTISALDHSLRYCEREEIRLLIEAQFDSSLLQIVRFCVSTEKNILLQINKLIMQISQSIQQDILPSRQVFSQDELNEQRDQGILEFKVSQNYYLNSHLQNISPKCYDRIKEKLGHDKNKTIKKIKKELIRDGNINSKILDQELINKSEKIILRKELLLQFWIFSEYFQNRTEKYNSNIILQDSVKEYKNLCDKNLEKKVKRVNPIKMVAEFISNLSRDPDAVMIQSFLENLEKKFSADICINAQFLIQKDLFNEILKKHYERQVLILTLSEKELKKIQLKMVDFTRIRFHLYSNISYIKVDFDNIFSVEEKIVYEDKYCISKAGTWGTMQQSAVFVFLKENSQVTVLHYLAHFHLLNIDNILRLEAICFDAKNEQYLLVFPNYSTNLLQLEELLFPELLEFSIAMATTIQELHRYSIAHRNISGSNILVEEIKGKRKYFLTHFEISNDVHVSIDIQNNWYTKDLKDLVSVIESLNPSSKNEKNADCYLRFLQIVDDVKNNRLSSCKEFIEKVVSLK